MSRYRLIIVGVIVFLVSVLVGVLGNIFGTSYMDSAVDDAAIRGISTITTLIERILLMTLFSIAGSMLGIILIIVGATKSNKNNT